MSRNIHVSQKLARSARKFSRYLNQKPKCHAFLGTQSVLRGDFATGLGKTLLVRSTGLMEQEVGGWRGVGKEAEGKGNEEKQVKPTSILRGAQKILS